MIKGTVIFVHGNLPEELLQVSTHFKMYIYITILYRISLELSHRIKNGKEMK